MSIRVRFAPSPTGYLHIGGARTALFNWLYARHTGGVFVLRIEDTDAARNTQEATDVILNGLRWLGLNWDEGPYYQSQRGEIYRRRVQQLKDAGHAYEAGGAVKFKMPRAPIVIPDLVVGSVTRELTDREAADPDFVIVRSDGQPVFHLVNVVDDLEMKITHVIRGEDHLSNTAKHIALFRAFGVEPPQYAHIPLILNPDGAKMSKRDRGASLNSYMAEGCVPEAVVNYLCLLGWSPKENREKMPVEETIRLFDLPQILRHNARFDIDKLYWLDGEYIREMGEERFHQYLGSAGSAARAGVSVNNYSAGLHVRAALDTCRGKIKRFADLLVLRRFLLHRRVANRSRSRRKGIHSREQTPRGKTPHRPRKAGRFPGRRHRTNPQSRRRRTGPQSRPAGASDASRLHRPLPPAPASTTCSKCSAKTASSIVSKSESRQRLIPLLVGNYSFY